jgi:hypothetical protein
MRKKSMAIFASVLFTASSMNLMASAVALDDPDAATCYTYADTWATRIGFWNSLSHYDEYLVFEALYDDCMNQ